MSKQDQIRGCMVGGAVGDALGYAVEFDSEGTIFAKYGQSGITAYEPDRKSGKAIISDDTQMALFTANGLLAGDTHRALHGTQGKPRGYVAKAYQDWLRTQEMPFETGSKQERVSWLCDVPELYIRRAPGNTCLSALDKQKRKPEEIDDYIRNIQINSKGCGGVMRIAPLALAYTDYDIRELDLEGAQIAAITHGHSLGYMPAAVLTHVIHRIVFGEEKTPLQDIVMEAMYTVGEIFRDDAHIGELTDLIDLAVRLAENGKPNLENIHRLGEGWVGDEAMAIALYCALRYEDDFSAGVIAAVNHKGDSDSTGAIAGNILGAIHGFNAMEKKWKTNLELMDVILEISDDLCHGCRMSEDGQLRDPEWTRKYVHMRRI